jgi:hypothetical protein
MSPQPSDGLAMDLRVSRIDPRGGAFDAELEAFLAACPDAVAQQTPGWRRVIEAIGVDEPRVLACRRRGELVAAAGLARQAPWARS